MQFKLNKITREKAEKMLADKIAAFCVNYGPDPTGPGVDERPAAFIGDLLGIVMVARVAGIEKL